MVSRLLVSLLVLMASHLPASAVVIDEGMTNLDTSTQLRWLDLTATTGLSPGAVAAGAGGWLNSGWRFATATEVVALWSQMGITSLSGPGTSDPATLTSINIFFAVFGLTSFDSNINLRASHGWIDPNGMGEPLGRQIDAAVHVRDGMGGAYVKNLVASTGYSSWDIGSYLVKPASSVPEPSSGLLLWIGGLGVAVALRRRWRTSLTLR